MTQNRNLSILADNVNTSGVLAVAGGTTVFDSTLGRLSTYNAATGSWT